MTKYLLSNGSEIDAEKDCECTFHNEPHWLYEDKIWKDRNTLMLDNKNFLGYAKEEQYRLQYKAWYMSSHGIEEIIRD
jgi:hypothetical protein